MDSYEFVKLMETKKAERAESAAKYRQRNIAGEIKKEMAAFRKGVNRRIFIFYGLRGIGKSIALNHALAGHDAMFVDGTALAYYNLDLVDVVKEYARYNSSRLLLVDELSDIKNWGKSLKVLYDTFGMKIIATGSSAIKIMGDRNEIIRRATFREIAPLSFGEYLRLKHGMETNVSAATLFASKPADAYVKAKEMLLRLPDLAKQFRDYMRTGFPLALEIPIEESADDVVTKTIVDDFPDIAGFNLDATTKARSIINTLALSKPDAVSLSKFSESAGCSKTTASNILNAFAVSSLLIPVLSDKKSAAKLRKEPKYLFSSPALRNGLGSRLVGEIDAGTLREDAAVSALRYGGFMVEYLAGAKHFPDYAVYSGKNRNFIEIGGPSKSRMQLRSGFLLLDDNQVDYRNGIAEIPLYLAVLI